jgi:hypothetical protein
MCGTPSKIGRIKDKNLIINKRNLVCKGRIQKQEFRKESTKRRVVRNTYESIIQRD